MKRLALLALVVVAACGAIGAQAHTLSLAFKAGDTYNYKFHATTKQSAAVAGMSVPIDLDVSADEAIKVNSVDSSGVADLTITVSHYSVKTVANGVTNTTTGMPANTVEVKVRADGTVAATDGKELAGGGPIAALSGFGGGFFVAAVLPDRAVKAGDTWPKTYDQTFPNSTGGIHVVSNSTYLRDETVNGVSAAVVETKSTGTIDLKQTPVTIAKEPTFSLKGTFTTDVTTWIDPNGHRIVKSHSTAHNDITAEISGATSTSNPGLNGPVTAVGDGITDLTPA